LRRPPCWKSELVRDALLPWTLRRASRTSSDFRHAAFGWETATERQDREGGGGYRTKSLDAL
jgi:hypothetical protein